jgi:AcrR family transcriptional regulator
MEELQIHITTDSCLFCKDPESSDLGRRIVEYGIEMIHELGYEAFTFKKLGSRINSNESSIYRYFESKHSFLVYLVNWYWSWIEYKLVFATTNIESEEEKLEKAIQLLTEEVKEDNNFTFINEVTLNKIIIAESSKAYHTKEVEKENEKGFYKTYTRVVDRVTEFVLGVNPNFKYPHMLISTIIEGAHHQRYFSMHLPKLTDCEEGKNNIVEFYKKLVNDSLKK